MFPEQNYDRPFSAGTRKGILLILSGFVFVYCVLDAFFMSSPLGFLQSTSDLGMPHSSRPFKSKMVHLDLKGAAPKVSFMKELFPLLKSLGVDSLLIEYEDMFPYTGLLKDVPRSNAYSTKDLNTILSEADRNHLEVIPLIQTFGHLEYVLKHPRFSHLSENRTELNSICLTNSESAEVINEQINQIRKAHPNAKRIHIGCDEAYHIAEDFTCAQTLQKEFDSDKHRMLAAHIARVANSARSAGFETIFAWNDMFQDTRVDVLKSYGLGDLITPIVWGYKEDVTVPGYFPDGLFDRLGEVFSSVWFASAYKGANGPQNPFPNENHYLNIHKSYVKLYKTNASVLAGRVDGMLLTGWARFSHHQPLCEILATAVPSLVTGLLFLDNVTAGAEELDRKVYTKLCGRGGSPTRGSSFDGCDFLGADAYSLVKSLQRSISSPYTSKRKSSDEFRGLQKQLNEVLPKYMYQDAVDEFIDFNVGKVLRRMEATEEQQQQIVRETFQLVSKRDDNVCNFLEGGSLIGGTDYRLIYRHYATLYFIFCVDSSESELGILDLIQVFVETLDRCFENVCELDLIFHVDKVHHILGELVMGGMVLETNMHEILLRIQEQEKLEKQEAGISAAPARAVSAVKNMNLPQQIKDLRLPDLPGLSNFKNPF